MYFMKIFFLLIYFIIFTHKSYAIDLFSTDFYNVDIINKNISEVKNLEIEKIKFLSFDHVINKILNKKDIALLKRKIDTSEHIENVIKNIIIENEFISNNKYKAKIKINFKEEEIVNLIRKLKLNYTDFYSDEYLLITSQTNSFRHLGLSKQNIFYSQPNISNYKFLNLKYPELSVNDRFVLPYNKIANLDIIALTILLDKYKTNNAFIINSIKINNLYKLFLYNYNLESKTLNLIEEIKLTNKDNFHIEIFNILNNWWKSNNYIDNKIINKYLCTIYTSNMNELNFINSSINSISQIKYNSVSKIKFGQNINNIIFFGDVYFLKYKLKKFKIKIDTNSMNECSIRMMNL